MNGFLEKTVWTLTERFGLGSVEFRGQVSLIVPASQIEEVCLALRDELGYEMLAAQTAVDYWPQQDPRFHLVYQLHSFSHKSRIALRLPVPGMDPRVPTIENIYPNANWQEREIWDMFGIHFDGHSDLRRILMPEDWEGHPLRKDYPLGYEEVQFTFNIDEVDRGKPYAKE